ncbi:hypothetical protein MATL_G00216180 [Megalops atlanticus]|uniref:Uncharacterized protein n=1 Tax=Megalops atlanticus TaxID=7932 RepID=A0A9D3T444_MEGAT|nr:hypothetical protein MATL_G00216180 [Megalops atlanticus]
MACSAIHMREEGTETQMTVQATDRNQAGGAKMALGTAVLGLVLGATGGYLLATTTSAVERAMTSLITHPLIANTTEAGKNQDVPLAALVGSAGFLTGLLLVVACLMTGITFGQLAASAVLRMKGPESGAKVLAAAGPVALLGVTATGAALGAVTEKTISAAGAAGLLAGLVGFILVILALYEMSLRLHQRTTQTDDRCIIWFPLITVVFIALLAAAWMAGFSQITLIFCSLMYVIIWPLLWPLSYVVVFCHFSLFSSLFALAFVQVKMIYNFQATGVLRKNAKLYLGVGTQIALMSAVISMIVSTMVVMDSRVHRGLGKISLGTAAAGQAVLTIIQSVTSVLGPGVTAGALLGAMGAAAVSVAAGLMAGFTYSGAGGAGAVLGTAGGVYLGIGAPGITFLGFFNSLVFLTQ